MASTVRSREFLVLLAGLPILLIAAGVRLMADNSYNFDFGKGRLPVCAIKVTIQPDQWGLFFTDIEKFAEINGFGVRVARLKPEKDIVYIDLWRPDTAIAGENVFEPSNFELSFYVDPSKGGTREAAVILANRLRNEVARIPGASAEVKEATD